MLKRLAATPILMDFIVLNFVDFSRAFYKA